MIDWAKTQSRLRVKTDGNPGRITFGALLEYVAGRDVPLALDLGLALSANYVAYGLTSPDRLGAFLGQTCHETAGFLLLREVWGPTAQQKTYDGRMGNKSPGDGYLYRGRGLMMLTGRDNYDDFGRRLKLDLVTHPELVEQPAAAVMTALEFWSLRTLNALADKGDDQGITRRINGGATGLMQRMTLTGRARGVLS